MTTPLSQHRPQSGEEGLRSLLMRGAGGTLVLRGASVVLGFGLTVVLARLLGASGYGAYAWAVAWAGVLRVPAMFGLDKLLVRDVATYRMHSAWGAMRGLLRRSWHAVAIISSLMLALAAIIGAVFVAPQHPELASAFWPMLPLVPLGAMVLVAQAAMQGLHKVVVGQIPDNVLRPLLVLVLVGGADAATHGKVPASWAVVSQVLATGVGLLATACLLRRALPSAVKSVQPVYATRVWARSAFPMLVIGGMIALTSQLDIILVGLIKGAKPAGIYGVVSRAAALLTLAPVAVNTAYAPIVARLHAAGDGEAVKRLTTLSGRVTLLVTAVGALILIAFAHVFLGIFNGSFAEGTTAVRILVAGYVVNALAGPSAMLLMMTGHERQTALGLGAGTLVNVVLNVALIPVLGIDGAAIAATVSLVAWNALLLWRVATLLGVDSSPCGGHRLANRIRLRFPTEVSG